MSNFLEHLPNKSSLKDFLEKIFNALKSRGKVIIMGPNIKYLHGVYWDYFDHHIPLTDNSLIEVLRISGFKILEAYDKFLPFSFKSPLPTHPILAKIYIQTPMLWKLYGKQFLIVAGKE